MADVTVLMPVYNAMPYLPEAVESVLAQTYGDLTLLVVDDGSQDGSLAYLQSLDDPRIEIVARPHAGLGATLNLGLSLCRTEYLARMDADDLIPRRRLEIQRDYLGAHPEVGAVGTQFRYFRDPERLDTRFSRTLPPDHHSIVGDLLSRRLGMLHASLLVRIEGLRRIGGYRTVGMGDNDWDLLLRLAEVTHLANIDEVLYLWRVHPGSVCARHTAQTQILVAYACDSACRRAGSQPELSFEEFLVERRRRPFWRRWCDGLDYYGAAHYKAAVIEVLGGQRLRGTLRLALAAACSPGRTLDRIGRLVRPLRPRPSRPRHLPAVSACPPPPPAPGGPSTIRPTATELARAGDHRAEGI